MLEGSRAFGVTYVYSNLLGNEAGRAIYDGGALIASAGQLLGDRAALLASPITASPRPSSTSTPRRMTQARTASFSPAIGGPGNDCIRAAFVYPDILPQSPQIEQAGVGERRSREGRRIRPRRRAGPLRLHAQEPLRRALSSRSAAGPIPPPSRASPGSWSKFGVARTGPRWFHREARVSAKPSRRAECQRPDGQRCSRASIKPPRTAPRPRATPPQQSPKRWGPSSWNSTSTPS